MTNCRESYNLSVIHNSSAVPRKTTYRFVKRTFDILLSFVAIVLTLVPMLIIAGIIRLESPGPAIFRQKRIGRDGKLFCIRKFRTMHCHAPSETATGQLENAGSYITRFGAFLRKSSLDELPQLFNVLTGDMSLIGPRPLIANEEDIHRMRQAANVYSVRPGMTGWAQVNGRDCVTVEEKVALDAEYVRNASFAFDLKIIWHTIAVVINGDGYAEGKQPESSEDVSDEIIDTDYNAA